MTDSLQADVAVRGLDVPAYPENLAVGADPPAPPRQGAPLLGDPATAPVAPITRDDAERALAEVNGSIAALQKRAESVFQTTWERAFNGPSGRFLDYDLKRTRIAVRDWMTAHGQPMRVEAAIVLLEAERRWSGVPAASWHPLAAARGEAQPAAQSGAPQLLARLAAKGVTLSAGADGKLLATPAGILNEVDKRQINESRAEIIAALAQTEEL
jgi:hypothetical protein